MTRLPELERALVDAGERRYTGSSWCGVPAPKLRFVALTATAATVSLLLIGVVHRNETPERELPAASSTPAPSEDTIELPSGEPVDPKRLEQLRRYGPLDSAYAIPAPPHAPDSIGSDTEEWIVIPNDDLLCVIFGNVSTCMSPEAFPAEGLVRSSVPSPDVPVLVEPGETPPNTGLGSSPATFEGLMPPGVAEVVAVTRAGDQVASVRVRDQAFSLTVPNAREFDHIELRRG